MITAHPLPTPYPTLPPPVEAQRERPSTLSPVSLETARDAQCANRAVWATLTLRQHWADATWMRAHLKVAGLIVSHSTEPATVRRLKSLLRRVGVLGPDIANVIGTDLTGYLRMNPGLPLWAALALLLEATGKFTPWPPVEGETYVTRAAC